MTAPSRPPFAWQDKRVLKKIREEFEDYGSALLTYLALSVAASDKQSEEFQTTHSWLGTLAGLSEKTVRLRLRELQRIGAVRITTPALRAPCTYRLLPFGTDNRTNGNHYRTFGNSGAPPLPGSEESKNLKGGPKKVLGQSEKITIEKQLTELRKKRDQLREDTSEPWQRKEYPERLEKLKAVEADIADLEQL